MSKTKQKGNFFWLLELLCIFMGFVFPLVGIYFMLTLTPWIYWLPCVVGIEYLSQSGS